MAKTLTTRYDVAEHLRTPEEMAVYLRNRSTGSGGHRISSVAVPPGFDLFQSPRKEKK